MPDLGTELRVVVVGAGGRMGQALVRAVLRESGMRLVGALDRQDSAAQGQDAGTLAGAGASGSSSLPSPLRHLPIPMLCWTSPPQTPRWRTQSYRRRPVSSM
jgi:4-hydroxy-tetrahydrodipicolinate reductase